MPLTALAHQAPLFPLRRWWPRLDVVAFVVGTTMPDLSAATLRTTPRWFLGMPLWRDGHRLDNQLTWSLPVGLLVAWAVRRLLAPRLGPCLPRLGAWNLTDLANVARFRHRWWVVCVSLLLGSLSHVVLDALTHEDRSVPTLPGLSTPLLAIGGRTLRVELVLQVLLSVGLAVYTVVASRRLARRHWELGEPARPAEEGRARWVRVAVVAGSVPLGAFALTQWERSPKIVVMTWAWLVFFWLVVVAVVEAAVPDEHAPIAERRSGM